MHKCDMCGEIRHVISWMVAMENCAQGFKKYGVWHICSDCNKVINTKLKPPVVYDDFDLRKIFANNRMIVKRS